MTIKTGIERIENYLQNEAELRFVKDKVFANGDIEYTFNIWLDDLEGNRSDLSMSSLKDFIESYIQYELDMFKDGFSVEEAIRDKMKYFSVEGKIHSLDSKIIPILCANDIEFELEQQTEEDEYTYFTVDFKFTPEQELLFKMLDLDDRFAIGTSKVAYVYYNGNESDYN